MKADEMGEYEIQSILEAIYQRYGYDFRQYAQAHIKRRLLNRMTLSHIDNFSEMKYNILNSEKFAAQLLSDLSITVTEMFRDPNFYKSVREKVIPILKTYTYPKIWHAGCSTGEEVYSIAIILQEEGLYGRTTIYATDFNQTALSKAKDGVFSNHLIKGYTKNYQLSGGNESFADYFTSDNEYGIINQSLRQNIVWANHNLVTDRIFAEVHMIICRNVLIYFGESLQNKVQNLFYNSLVCGGILCLGAKESLRFSEVFNKYTELDAKQRIFKVKY